MRQHVHDRIESVVEGLRNVGIASVYLFGSMATDTAHPESDVDLGVLVDWSSYQSTRERFDLRLKLISFFGDEFRMPVDVVILNDVPPTLGRAIVIGGERVVCLDEAVDHAWVRDIQLKAADIDPFLRRMRSIKLEAIAPGAASIEKE